jgi:hypothetical protein
MKASEVTAHVVECALRFGDRNPQQIKYLVSRLGQVAEANVAEGLLCVFTHGAAPPQGSAAQELAGQLLAALNPKAESDLRQVLRAALSRYELSVEQLPQYLRSVFGLKQVLFELEQLDHEPLSDLERRALQTMQFWLGRAEEQNGT